MHTCVMRITRASCIYLLALANPPGPFNAHPETDTVGINLETNVPYRDVPSLKYQAELDDRLKEIGEEINNLDHHIRGAGSSPDTSGAARNTIRDNADEVGEEALFENQEFERKGRLDADNLIDASRYSAQQHLNSQESANSRVIEKLSDKTRSIGIDALEKELNVYNDREDRRDRAEDLLSNDDITEEDDAIKREISSFESDAHDALSNANEHQNKLSRRSKLKLREENTEHIMQQEDCPPGYVSRSNATPEELANADNMANSALPCPVALADAPCPCIMESFEPLKMEKPEEPGAQKMESPKTESEKMESPKTESQSHDMEPDQYGEEGCEDFMSNVKSRFADKMDTVTTDALKPLTKNLKKGVKVGIRKFSDR